MTTRTLRSKADLRQWVAFLEHRKFPVTVSVTDGRVRSTEQNKLQRLWCKEIAEQFGDRSPEDVRGEIKLRFGVPILRAQNDLFREKYDATIRPLSYEAKVAIMMEPLDLPVTRLMSVAQKRAFLDAVCQHYTEQGIELTQPDMRRAPA